MVKKATRISRFFTAAEDRPIYVGLGVHKRTYSVALFNSEDGTVETYTCPWIWHDPAAKAIYNHHFAKHGIGQKAIVAVARKLAIKLWRMTVETPPSPVEGVARGAWSVSSTTKRAAPSSTGAYRKRYLVILYSDRHE